MEEKTFEMLDEEIQANLDAMSEMTNITNEDGYGDAVTNTAKLLDQKIAWEKLKIEKAKVENEQTMAAKKLKSENIDRWVKHGLVVLTTAATIGLKVWGTKFTMKYEDTGKIPTTFAGRNFISDLFRKD